jgi:hypothetical protein
VLGQDIGILLAQLFEQARRPLDVREEESERSSVQIAHGACPREY